MGIPPDGMDCPDWPWEPGEEDGEDEGEGEGEGDEGVDGLPGIPGIEGGALDGIGDEEGIDGIDGGDCDCCGDLQPATPTIRSKKRTPGKLVIAYPPMIVRPLWLQDYPILLEHRPQWEFAQTGRYSA